MRKTFCYVFLLLLSIGIIACQQQKTSKPAHLRAISMVQFTPAKLTIKGQKKNEGVEKTFLLNYADPTDYQTFTPGYYDITLSVKGKVLLKGTYALGKNGYYSLLAMGLLPNKWNPNPRTTMYELKYIFAGEELKSANKYLPQWTMMRDNYDGSKKSSYIRLVNANPTTAKLNVKKGTKSLKGALAYPMESSMLKLKPGNHDLHIMYGKVEMDSKTIQTKPGYIYTVIVGSKENQADKLTVPVLSNPSRALLQSQ